MTNNNDELGKLIAKYTDYCECEEWHIHQNDDGIEPNADKTDGHYDYDEEKFKSDLDHYANQRVVDALKKILSSFDGATVNPESPAFKPFRQLILTIEELEAKQD